MSTRAWRRRLHRPRGAPVWTGLLGTRRAIQRLPTVSVSPWRRIDARITNDAAPKISSLWGTAELSTSRENSIEATPFGPNHAMKSFTGRASRVPASETSTAAGRATASANPMNSTSAPAPWPQCVSMIRAPNRKNVATWNTALTFSLKCWNASGMSCSATPSATPATNAAIRPLPKVASASP